MHNLGEERNHETLKITKRKRRREGNNPSDGDRTRVTIHSLIRAIVILFKTMVDLRNFLQNAWGGGISQNAWGGGNNQSNPFTSGSLLHRFKPEVLGENNKNPWGGGGGGGKKERKKQNMLHGTRSDSGKSESFINNSNPFGGDGGDGRSLSVW